MWEYELSDGPPSGNQGIKLVKTRSETIVVRHFPSLTFDSRLRWLREVKFLNWANSNRVSRFVPKILSHSLWEGLVLEEFVEGVRVTQPSIGNYRAAAEFFRALVQAETHAFRPALPAKESLRSADLLESQIRHRKSQVSWARSKLQEYPNLTSILNVFSSYQDGQLSRDCSETLEFAKTFSGAIGVSSIVSPSDFGFHNFIETNAEGEGIFVDFEYAGIDHPLKTLMDFLMQPEHRTHRRDAATFAEALGLPIELVCNVPPSTIRVFAIKWAAITARKAFLNPKALRLESSLYSQRIEKYERYFRCGFE